MGGVAGGGPPAEGVAEDQTEGGADALARTYRPECVSGARGRLPPPVWGMGMPLPSCLPGVLYWRDAERSAANESDPGGFSLSEPV
jgi:hypothetical protein